VHVQLVCPPPCPRHATWPTRTLVGAEGAAVGASGGRFGHRFASGRSDEVALRCRQGSRPRWQIWAAGVLHQRAK